MANPYISKGKAPIIRLPTVLFVFIIGGIAFLFRMWITHSPTLDEIAHTIQQSQDNPPFWLDVPFTNPELILSPALILGLVTLLITRVIPAPTRYSRAIVVGILLALTIRYTFWRVFSSLNLNTPVNGILSISFLLLEIITLTSSTIQLYLMVHSKVRHQQADRAEAIAKETNFTPSVDILIPTFNESAFILRRTIIGCQSLDYSNKKIYLLDDGNRPEIQQLAKELDCNYIARSNNEFAKAGNLNNAIRHIQGELIVVFDADFIPTQNFLNRTVGFFQDSRIALVQTPQSFYNADPIAWNLGLEQILTPDEEVFYRQIQPIRDGAGSVTCAGTSFVVRSQALRSVGGFVTESLCEDYFTGIRLAAKGYDVVYLKEKLSAGLAAETIGAHLTQRIRWAQGSLQGLFIHANPLTIPGLTLRQRIAHLEGLIYWFSNLARLAYLILPIVCVYFQVSPIKASGSEVLYYFLPYYLVSLISFRWLNEQSRSAILSDIYSLILLVPLSVTIIQTLIQPFNQGFSVTPKGINNKTYLFNWNIAAPLLLLISATGYTLWKTIAESSIPNQELARFWLGYNFLMMLASLLILVDAPKPDRNEWFTLHRTIQITSSHHPNAIWGHSTLISETGIEIDLTEHTLSKRQIPTPEPVTLQIMELELEISGEVVAHTSHPTPKARIIFQPLTLEQQRKLFPALYCRPHQWLYKKTPGEIHSLGILLKTLAYPQFLTAPRQTKIRSITVSQS